MYQIILCGLSSGKTSIKRVVFDKIPPYELELNKHSNPYFCSKSYSFGYCKVNLTEFPSSSSYQNNYKEYENYLINCDILIFVIDYKKYNLSTQEQTEYFKNSIIPIMKKYKDITLYIFIHTIDNYNANNILQTQYNDELQKSIIKTYSDYNINIDEFKKKFFITSIYNSTLYEAFSTILQNKIPQAKNLSILVKEMGENSSIDNAYLFDINNKFCLASYKPNLEKVNMFDICLNMIDFALELSNIYEESEDKNDNINKNFDEDLDYSMEINNYKNGVNDTKSIVFLKYIFKNLVLISIISREKNEKSHHLLEYNINILKEGVIRIFKP